MSNQIQNSPLYNQYLIEQLVERCAFNLHGHERMSIGFVSPKLGNQSIEIQPRQGSGPARPENGGLKFSISSLTKAFTGTVALNELRDRRGELASSLGIDLTSPLQLEGRQFGFSLSQLLDHSHGRAANDLLWISRALKPKRAAEALALSEPIGTGTLDFSYSNIGYQALGELLEKLLKINVEAEILSQILDPLGMHNSGFLRQNSFGRDFAVPTVNGESIQSRNVRNIRYAGGMYSTAEDLVKWLRAYQILYKQNVIDFVRSNVEVKGVNPLILQGLDWIEGPIRYRAGWFIGGFMGTDILFHPGYIDGFTSFIAIVPQMELGIVVLSNLNLSERPPVIGGALLGQRELKKSKTEVPEPKAEPASCSFDLSPWLGAFLNHLFGKIEINIRERELKVTIGEEEYGIELNSPSDGFIKVEAFGVVLPVAISMVNEGVLIHTSMDPRLGPQKFLRTG